ncbi:MAG: hypothetical protein PHN75_08145 [Syntrophales bacterium]|nr:hypothetical protein [Syntrophales bacterium]
MENVIDFLKSQIVADTSDFIITEDGQKFLYIECHFSTNVLTDFFTAYPQKEFDMVCRSLARKLFSSRQERNLYGLMIEPQTAKIVWAMRRDFFEKVNNEIQIKKAENILLEAADKELGEKISLVSTVDGKRQ